MNRKIASTNWFDAGDPAPAAETADLTPPPAPDAKPWEPAPTDSTPQTLLEDDGTVAPMLLAGDADLPPPPEVPTPPARVARSKRKPRVPSTSSASDAGPAADTAVVPAAPRTRRARPNVERPKRDRTDRTDTAAPAKPGRPTSRRRRIASLVVTALLVAAWSVTLRPTWLGGPASVLTVRGASMEPTYHFGDIVIAHRSSAYGVGDVIAFRVAEGEIGEGTVVIHRIIGGDGTTGFITQGDNNPDPDEWLPLSGDILGAARFHIPALGKLVTPLRTVPGIALVAGLLAALLVVFGTEGSGKRRSRARRRTEGVSLPPAESESAPQLEGAFGSTPAVVAELTSGVATDRVAIESIPDDDPLDDLISPPQPRAEPPIPVADPLEDLISLPPLEPAAPETTPSPMPVSTVGGAAEGDGEAPIVGEYWGDLEHLAAILRERNRPNAVFDDDLDEVARSIGDRT